MRHYDPTYGRFMSVDPLWAKYAPLQPYHYAGNEPVGRLDPSGMDIIAIRHQDQQHLSSVMQSQFGVAVSFTQRGMMLIESEQIADARNRLDPVGLELFNGVLEIAKATNIAVNYFAIEGTDNRRTDINLIGMDASGTPAVPLQTSVVTGETTGEEQFVSDPNRPQNAAIVIRPDLANTARFDSDQGKKTTLPCGTCVAIHALIDHALPWVRGGANPTRSEGVKAHNQSLQRTVGGPVRDGTDHGDKAKVEERK
mgnify:CR=1 FL=1